MVLNELEKNTQKEKSVTKKMMMMISLISMDLIQKDLVIMVIT